ncbi:hypothetical protein CAEBREN_08754 [Caenorhabditis brenneri]|uniref:Uncharacterized protein n=1 Tax=Caenorhabditis brenneri TaxID=135651 RepID=G0NWE3_CAEBE|nr:hypothetical protein CAEBREN_08754 [Caenorhabditis brenneri]
MDRLVNEYKTLTAELMEKRKIQNETILANQNQLIGELIREKKSEELLSSFKALVRSFAKVQDVIQNKELLIIMAEDRMELGAKLKNPPQLRCVIHALLNLSENAQELNLGKDNTSELSQAKFEILDKCDEMRFLFNRMISKIEIYCSTFEEVDEDNEQKSYLERTLEELMRRNVSRNAPITTMYENVLKKMADLRKSVLMFDASSSTIPLNSPISEHLDKQELLSITDN